MTYAHSLYAEGVTPEIPEVSDTLTNLLDKAVKDYPERVAIDFLGSEYSYRKLYKEIQRAASVLRMCGVREGDVVATLLPNCPQHFVAFFAVSYLGATVSEHNPIAAVEEITQQLEIVKPRVVIAWDSTINRLLQDSDHLSYTFLAVNLIRALPRKSQLLLKLPIKAAQQQKEKLTAPVPSSVHSWDNMVRHAEPLNLDLLRAPDLDTIAVLIQTGGTTGTPKAVQLSHRNIVSNTTQIRCWMNTFQRGNETGLSVLPFFHAFGLQLSLALCVSLAATQVMAPKFDADIVLAGNKRHPITFFAGVPPMFDRILRSAAGTDADLSAIRFSFSGAMPLDPQLAAKWEEATGGFIIEGYGLSEASPVVAGSPVSPARRPSTLGLPFPSTEVKVVDPDDPDVEMPLGEVGEMLVKGPQVFCGYFQNAAETEISFHNGWLRTGDLARWDNGFLVMTDRRKEMIINGGFNVYPSEVESAVRDIAGVADVAVVGMPEEGLRENIVAAIVLEPGAKIDLETVRQWTEKKLSHYAMPKSIAIMDSLPRSQLGKVLRRSVREQLENFEMVSGEWRKKLTKEPKSDTDSDGEILDVPVADATPNNLEENKAPDSAPGTASDSARKSN